MLSYWMQLKEIKNLSIKQTCQHNQQSQLYLYIINHSLGSMLLLQKLDLHYFVL